MRCRFHGSVHLNRKPDNMDRWNIRVKIEGEDISVSASYNGKAVEMKNEYKVGEKIILEVQEQDCQRCFFNDEGICYAPPTIMCCDGRTDNTNVAFVEKKGINKSESITK